MQRQLLAILLVGLVASLGAVASGAAVAEKPAAPAVAQPEGEEPQPAASKPGPLCQYLRNRGKDFLDIFNLKLALGDGSSFLFHIRATRLIQLGVGHFVGTKVGFEGPSAGTYGEGRNEGGISIFYWAWIGRKASSHSITEDAEKTNRFFGRVEDIKNASTYHEFWDANRPWHTVGVALSLPFLPGIEAEINPAEAVDFVLSFIPIRGIRVPPPFYKIDAKGEKVPAPNSIRWHGQEEFEQYD